MDGRQWRGTVAAAQAGDRRALDELVAGWLPLVYNIVGRALNGHADVDDVVQETMLRAVHGLDSLRDPDSFRSWLVAIAMRQIRDRARRQQATTTSTASDSAASDFAELTVLRLQLEGQRREVAEAVRWLEDEDRQLLSLWWLEVAGELSRREVAAALRLTRQHTAVRVQRLKSRLEAARSIVRALGPRSRCRELARLTARWDGHPDSVWRKRLARHVRGCAHCGEPRPDFVPAERLLVGIALVPVPAGLTLAASGLLAMVGGAGGKAAAVTAGTGVGAGVGTSALGADPVGWSAHLLTLLAKPAVAVTAGATLVAGGGAFVIHEFPDEAPARPAPRSAPRSASPTPSAASAPVPPLPSPTSRPRPSTSPASRYGSVVDAVDRAPDPNRRPGPLPRRAETSLTSTHGDKAVLTHRGESVTFSGRGYVLLRWQLVPSERPGSLVMPAWTGLDGKLFHVASGGGRRMDDALPGTSDGRTWMGGPATGYAEPPPGTQQMWQNEYFYLDGTVTLTQNERGADYNLSVMPSSWAEADKDIRTAPEPGSPEKGLVRYGLVRDTGDDGTPVPQYVTRGRPADAATVQQRSALSG